MRVEKTLRLTYLLLVFLLALGSFGCSPGLGIRAVLFLAVLLVGVVGIACAEDSPKNTSENTSDDVDVDAALVTKLTGPGNEVLLRTTEGTIVATVVDSDEDGEGDGLDLDGTSASAEIIYLSGALSAKGGATKANAVFTFGFYFAADPNKTKFYFTADGEGVSIKTSSDGTGEEVVFVISGGEIIGLDTDGDGSSDAGEDFVGGIKPIFSEGEIDNVWVQDAYLKASNNSYSHHLGQSVAISGDTAVVGAPSERSNTSVIDNVDGSAPSNVAASGVGAAFIFKRNGAGDWIQDAYLKASNSNNSDAFGDPVAVSGDTVVVGVPFEGSVTTAIINVDGSAAGDATTNYNGAAYVFKKDGSGNWIQDAYLKASNNSNMDTFGAAVAVDGDTVVAGSKGEASNTTTIDNADGSAAGNDSGASNGAAYIFKKDGFGDWIQDAYLKASNSGGGEQFGKSVAASADVIVVAAFHENSTTATIDNTDGSAAGNDDGNFNGAAYVFKKDGGGNWIQDAYLKAPNNSESDSFGSAVAISADTVVVGAYYEGSSTVAIDNTDGSADGNESGAYNGAAYIFKKNGSGDWIQDAYLKASNSSDNDEFGDRAAISGDRVVIGAKNEDSSTMGVDNTDGSAAGNDSGTQNGAAYVFKKNAAGDWIQDAYLKSSNNDNTDYFGCSVGISGDSLIVGAYGEGSYSAVIENTDGAADADNTGSYNGAAYVFTLK